MKFVSAVLATIGLSVHLALGSFPGTPEQPFTTARFAATLGLWFFFSTSLLAWGSVINHLLGDRTPWTPKSAALSFSFGTGVAALFGMLLGELGLISASCKPLLIALLALGHALRLLHRDGKEQPASTRKVLKTISPPELVLLACFAFIAATSALISLQPAVGSSDEFRYHLVGPKLWVEAGRVALPPAFPLAMQCSFWEYVYVWCFALAGAKGAAGLIEGQFLAQWTHVFLGYVGGAFALFFFFRTFAGSRLGAACAALSALSFPFLLNIAPSAKNDWGILLWCATGLGLLFESRHDRCRDQAAIDLRHLAAGGLLGLAIGGKYTAAFAVAPFCFAWIAMTASRRPRRVTALAAATTTLGILATLTPLLLRNFLATGSPFYPALSVFFDSPWLGPTWRWYQSQYEVAGFETNLRALAERFSSLIRWWPLIVVLPAAPMIGSRLTRTRLMPLTLSALAGLTLFVMKARPGYGDYTTYWRLAGLNLLALIGASVLTLEPLLLKASRSMKLALSILLSFYLMGSTMAPISIWSYIWRAPRADEAVRSLLLGGEAKEWLRRNVHDRSLVVSSGDNQIYYVSSLNVVVIPEQPELDALTRDLNDPAEILKVLRDHDARYLLEVRHWQQLYWNDVARLLMKLVLGHPGSIAFAGRDSLVVDLKKLEAEAAAACVAPPQLNKFWALAASRRI